MVVSVITVTFNCASTIEKTIRSVIDQDYNNMEYIVIDGFSTDGTKELIAKYEDSIAYYCSEKDSGIYNAMNKGLAHATGDIIIFLNGDDYFYDYRVVSNIVRQFEINPQIEIIIGKESINGRIPDTYNPEADVSLYYGVFFPHQATFIKKSVFDKIGDYDESYRISADYEWVLRACYNGINIKWIDNVISVFSSGGRSASVACVAEEYQISIKYLGITDSSELFTSANKHYSFEFCNIFLWEILNNPVEDEIISVNLRSLFDIEKPLYVWGAGINGAMICSLLINNHFAIEGFYDSNSSKIGSNINGIIIKEFDGSESFIIISSIDYESEIAQYLMNKGLKESVDFIKYSDIAYKLAKKVFEVHPICKEFFLKTGLDVCDYI